MSFHEPDGPRFVVRFRHHFGTIDRSFACLVQTKQRTHQALLCVPILFAASSLDGFHFETDDFLGIGLFSHSVECYNNNQLSIFLDDVGANCDGLLQPMLDAATHDQTSATDQGPTLFLPWPYEQPNLGVLKRTCHSVEGADIRFVFWTCKTCATKPCKAAAMPESLA